MTQSSPARRTVPIVSGVIGLIVVAFLVVLAGASPSDGVTASSPLLGRAAPVVRSETLDGATFEIARRRGSWVMLNFFNSTCVPCIQEHGVIKDFVESQSAKSDAVEFFTIINDDNDAAVKDFFRTNGGNWPQVKDSDGAIAVAFGVAKVPETWIIDPNGFVRMRVVGAVKKGFLEARMTELYGQSEGSQQ